MWIPGKASDMFSLTWGILDDPPTRSRESMSDSVNPLESRVLLMMSTVAWIRGLVAASNSLLVTL